MGVDTTFKQWDGSYRAFVGMLMEEEATAFVVHGRGPRRSEYWVHPSAVGLQGWEVLDVSEAARARLRGPWGPYHALTLILGSPVGLGDEALLHLLREGFDTRAARAYDSLRLQGPLVATAGLNVHPKVGLGPLLIPSYGPFFGTLVAHVAVRDTLPRDPRGAHVRLAQALGDGDLFLSAGRTGSARAFRFAVLEGEVPVARPGRNQPAFGRMRLRAGFARDPGVNLVYRVLRNGKEMEWVLGPALEWEVPYPGFYRVEVYAYTARIGETFLRLRPWIFSNTVGLVGPGDGSR
jgi:hypothetical protein